MMTMEHNPYCRIDIREDVEGECWHVICNGDGWITATNMAEEALEAAFNHYRSTPHRGQMFIDFKPEAVNQ